MDDRIQTFLAPLHLDPAEVMTRGSNDFARHTKPWSIAYDRSPKLAIAPRSLETLQKVIKALYASDLDFVIRGCGTGNASASEIVLSMIHFDSITVDASNEYAIIGAGCDWSMVDRALNEKAPDNLVVGARCPYVGVAGATLAGGFSWLSHEFGVGSDPQNLLDVQMILADGRLVWASEEDPDLLWALRGGGGNFGVATALKLRLRAHPNRIFAANITFPYSSLAAVSAAVSTFATQSSDPKLAAHVFVVSQQNQMALHHGDATTTPEPQIMLLAFDGHGTAHAHSQSGFAWALSLPGAQIVGAAPPGDLRLADVHELQRGGQATHGASASWYAAALVPGASIDTHYLERAVAWYRRAWAQHRPVAPGAFVLLEVMQAPAFTSSGGPGATAWPHGAHGRQHVLQLGVGAAPGVDPDAVRDEGLALLMRAPGEIGGYGEHAAGDWLPNFLTEAHDPYAVFGANWERLRRVKGRYDARDRFDKGGLRIPPLV